MEGIATVLLITIIGIFGSDGIGVIFCIVVVLSILTGVIKGIFESIRNNATSDSENHDIGVSDILQPNRNNNKTFAISYQKYAVTSEKRNISNFKYSMRQVDAMSGVEFERFCAKLLKYNGFSCVETTSASGDQGVDIIASKNGIRYAIQCKHYNTSKVSNSAIQEVFAGMKYYRCSTSVVITNSHFTRQAEELARCTATQLWGRNKLQELIHTASMTS